MAEHALKCGVFFPLGEHDVGKAEMAEVLDEVGVGGGVAVGCGEGGDGTGVEIGDDEGEERGVGGEHLHQADPIE